MRTFKLVYRSTRDRKVYLKFFAEGYPLPPVRLHSRQSAPARLRHVSAGKRPVPARHRRAGPRCLVAADGGHARVAVDRARRRHHQPVPRRAVRRHLRPLRRTRRYGDPARSSRSCARFRPSRSGWGWRPRCPTLVVGTGLFRHHHHHLADRLDRSRARRARPLPLAARGGFRRRRRADGRKPACASSSATCCRRSRATSSRRSALRSRP